MSKLVLVRHSKPEVDPTQPAQEWRLGETGRRRAKLLAGRLDSFAPTVIWSSKETKAIETAGVIAGAFQVPVRVTHGLEEHHRRGTPYFSTQLQFEGAIKRFFAKPDQLVLGAETADQALKRFTGAINQAIALGGPHTIVVTHGTVMALYVASKCGVSPMAFWKRLGLPSFVVIQLPKMKIDSIFESVLV